MMNATIDDVRVRPARPDDRPRMLELWERSVRATHHFLEEHHIAALRPLVAMELERDTPEWWVLVTPQDDTPIGFLGYANDTIEALFIDPARLGQGGGRRLVTHAESLAGSPLAVAVNEENRSALAFYEALGFSVVSRSPVDDAARPFPILHMRQGA